MIAISLAVTVLASSGLLVPVQAGMSMWTHTTAHQAIHVDNDSELSSMVTREVWRGAGTVADPYVIKNFEIYTTGEGSCILIGNTTSFLIIQNCHLFGGKPSVPGVPGGVGITLYNVENVVLRDNDCSENYLGLYLFQSSNCIVNNNTSNRNTEYSVTLENCTKITVSNNECNNNSQHSIEVYNSPDCLIENNTCNDNEYQGIQLNVSSNDTLRNNTCRRNGMFGILIDHSDANVIQDNLCDANGHFGINLEYSNGSQLTGNVLTNNNGAKAVYDPHHGQAQDLGGNNSWNNSTAGNQWGDWTGPDADGNGIVDVPYAINSGGSKDYYPLAIASSDLNWALIIAALLAVAIIAAIGLFFWRTRSRLL
jgi:parallel beta-helix repeat protein